MISDDAFGQAPEASYGLFQLLVESHAHRTSTFLSNKSSGRPHDWKTKASKATEHGQLRSFEAARSPQRNWYGTAKAPRYGPTKLKSGLQCVAGFSRRGRGKWRSHFECKHQQRTVEKLFLIPESLTQNPARRQKQEKAAILAIILTYKRFESNVVDSLINVDWWCRSSLAVAMRQNCSAIAKRTRWRDE